MTDPFLTSRIPYFVAQIRDRTISHRDKSTFNPMLCVQYSPQYILYTYITSVAIGSIGTRD